MTEKKKIDDSELAEISGAGDIQKIQPDAGSPGENLDDTGSPGGGGGATGGPESEGDGGGLTEPELG
jgi:hypothetical protein